MKAIDHIISRLETRNMSVSGLKVTWCPCCMHVLVKDPESKGGFEVIWLGEDGCRQSTKSGTITEAIADLRASQ